MRALNMLAIDLGASGGKCFAGELRDDAFAMHEIHRFAHEGVPFFLADRHGAVTERTYWNDTGIYAHILQGLHTFRRDVGDQLDGVAVDTWGADGQFVGPDGECLGKMYAYRDHRLDGMVDKVKQRVDAARVYAITGIHFQFFNVSGQLHWFVRNRPHLCLPGVRFLPVPALFSYYLSGAMKVDSTWASVSQLMDPRAGDWCQEILDALEIPPEWLPEIVPPATVIGHLQAPLAGHVRLNRAAVVAVGSHDTACAFAAAPVDDPATSLIISSGTWSLIGKLLPAPVTSPEAMAYNVSNEGGIGNTRVLKNCMGSWLTQELRRAWRTEDGREAPWSELDTLTMQAAPFLAFVDPDDAAFVNPPNMQEAIVAYCRRTGQTPPTDRGAMLRAVCESLALKYRLVSEQLCAVSGTSNRAVHIVGGGSRNVMLNQFTADALNLPVYAGPEEATAVGNLMTQAVALGQLPDLAAAQPLIRAAFPIRAYAPRDTASWDAAYARFRRIVG